MTHRTSGDTNVFFYFPKFDRNRGIHWMHFCLYMSHSISDVHEIPFIWLADRNLSSNRGQRYSPQNGIAPTNAWFFPSVPITWILINILVVIWQGKNVDPGFRMRVRMTQLPRLPSPASAEFRNFVSKIQAHRPESGQVEATEWNCYKPTWEPHCSALPQCYRDGF